MSSPALPLPAVASSVKHKRGSSASSFTSQVTPPAKLSGLVPRRVYLLVLALVLVVLFPPRPPLPPSYKATWRTERALARAFPDNAAKDTKLLLVQTRRNTGFNSQLLPHIVQHHLSTSLLGRTYAFQPYVFSTPTWTSFLSHSLSSLLKSAEIPLTAYVRHFGNPPTATFPATVGANTFESACPQSDRVVVGLEGPSLTSAAWHALAQRASWKQSQFVPASALGGGEWSTMLGRMDRLREMLETHETERCLEIRGDVWETLSSDISTSAGLWESVKASEVVRAWKWGPSIEHGIKHAVDKLVGAGGVLVGEGTGRVVGIGGVVLGGKAKKTKTDGAGPSTEAVADAGLDPRPDVLVGLLGLHLPTIIYSHCSALSSSLANFTSFASSPSLSDRFPTLSPTVTPHGRRTVYLDHCAPSVERVLARSARIRREHPRLRSVVVSMESEDGVGGAYLGRRRWQEILTRPESEGGGGWEHVFFENDLVSPSVFGWGGLRELGVGVSMELLRRAEVFMGNGFSPMTANVVMLRQRDARPVDTTRFW